MLILVERLLEKKKEKPIAPVSVRAFFPFESLQSKPSFSVLSLRVIWYKEDTNSGEVVSDIQKNHPQSYFQPYQKVSKEQLLLP